MILVVDNYDSFTFNLVQYLGMCGAETVVERNDQITLENIISMNPSGIMLSPGPCSPDKSGVCLEILNHAQDGGFESTPIFGVCLGHQAIGLVCGATIERAGKMMHGKSSMVRHDGRGLFQAMPNPFRAIRYHSLVISPSTMPSNFTITATSEDDGEIMGLRHESLPIEGVQFHPESILTENGLQIVRNFVNRTLNQG